MLAKMSNSFQDCVDLFVLVNCRMVTEVGSRGNLQRLHVAAGGLHV